MAKFPLRESEIARLAQDMANGLAANPGLYPAPPAGPAEIAQALEAYNIAREAGLVAQANAVQHTLAKDKALAALVELLRTNLRYAEAAVRNDDGKLQLIGWGRRRKPTPTENQEPGQVANLEVLREGNTWISLGWKAPFDGGEVSAYKVQRRKRDTGEWLDVGTSVEREITLHAQENGVEWEYRVIAVNKAGEGPASNIVRAVL